MSLIILFCEMMIYGMHLIVPCFSSPGWCVFLTVFVKTSKLTNYCWMLCEGLYLYKLIVYAFKEQTRAVSIPIHHFSFRKSLNEKLLFQIHFYLVGWALPVVTIIPYVIVHWALPEHNDKCWTESMGNLEWLHYPLPLFCLSVSKFIHSEI